VSAEPIVRVVDDDPSYARALGRLLGARGYPARIYGSGAELLGELNAETRGCVVMDLNMPGMNGLELQTELARRGARLPVVFLTGAADIPSSVSAMRGGAVDFLEKRAPSEQLIAAVERALASEREQQRLRERFARLTERELEVLRQVVRGRMNKQIAADLGIHERTVKLHRSAVTSKVGVRSVAELTTLARDAGLL
jgi:FixJ family two-component response regulator